ncbi:MAG: GGDEF domain-containing protein [Lachnospiraceae bacterium]|nr:GGDEF domain-containing protein [Lachnospiraceae bacterium]
MDHKVPGTESGSLFNRIVDFINKDVEAKNETKKLTVVIRILLISVMVYFSINGIINVKELNFAVILFYVLFFAIFAGLFVISYYCRSMVTLWIFNFGMIVWIYIILYLYGWNIGVQHFLMVMLVLFFFSSYKRYTRKIMYAVFLCALRILLFYICRYRDPLWPLTASGENMLQIVNTITIFWCLSVVVFIFSNNSQELERKLMDYNMQLEELANTDALTGLNNRRKALQYMEYLIQKSSDYTTFSLCICDIDFFKKVNDNYGHDFGDEVLKGISQIFKKELKGKDFVARWGGEEFLLLFPDCNRDDAYLKVENIRDKIKSMKIRRDDIEVSVTMTFGLTEYDFNSDLVASIKEADERLYQGKEQGRDRIIY